ncbi:MAG: class I adenylate-forming enzyme family protein, partial [Acidimicrobiales bacterium]
MNSTLGPAEAAPSMAKARANLLVTTPGERAAHSVAADAGVPIAHLDPDRPPWLRIPIAATPAKPHARQEGASERGPLETDSHVMFFTSGSTGAPKGTVLSHRVSCLRTFPPNAPAPPGATVCMFPLFHMAAWTLALGCWQARQEIVLVPRPDPELLLSAVVQRRARRIYLIPAVWGRILAHLERDVGRWDLATLEEADTGTSATPPELLSAIHRALPQTRTRVLYGSTEAGSASTLSFEDIERKPGSVGLPSLGVELRLTEQGEVCVRSELLMEGYFEDPEATAIALRDGWYHTGDLGQTDEEGFLYIVGRVLDVIRTGGETVAPAEVEQVLRSLGSIAEVVVVGAPDDQWGEVVCAVVVPANEERIELEDLRAACTGLASFKQPRRLEVVDSLPRTAATGQVQR